MCNKTSEQAKITQMWENRPKSQILYLFMYIRGPRKAVGVVGKRRSKEAGEGFFIKKPEQSELCSDMAFMYEIDAPAPKAHS